MYRFQLFAPTQIGESLGIIGSTPELGAWDITKYIRLQTNSDRYPLWWTGGNIDIPANTRVEYKYVRIDAERNAEWEAFGENRWLMTPENYAPEQLPDQKTLQSGGVHDPNLPVIVVDDGAFGYLQNYPFGYFEPPQSLQSQPKFPPKFNLPFNLPFNLTPKQKVGGLKIVVIGSSVALGHKAWLLEGWAWQLAQVLQEKYGHQLVNVSEVGANTSHTIARFPLVVTPEKPDVVIIALSLGNERFAHCPEQERRSIQRRFESNLQQLVKMVRDIGAYPILGGVYPHNDYGAEHYQRLRDTHKRMLHWGVPILDWLAAVDDGQGRWQPGISFDPAHPNTLGHQQMFQAIDLHIFAISQSELARAKQLSRTKVPLFIDHKGFHVSNADGGLRILNSSPYCYTIAPSWQELQTALEKQGKLIPGIYIAKQIQQGTRPFFAVSEEGTIATILNIANGVDLTYTPAFPLLNHDNPDLIFYNGSLGIVREGSQSLWIINESDHDYNIQPMWQAVRQALKTMPLGVYEDVSEPDVPFRTMMIGNDGLESRVKVPPKSAVFFQYKCPLSEISRVAILPLGDRCAVRMMLYKMEYDGPAFPFDLTRSTKIADVADAIKNRFHDMWNPDLLQYNAEAKRIYHTKWTGLSFAHEVEETEDPENDMSPIHERMRSRYSARSARFWYALGHCDKVLFIRTGICDRAGVIDLVHKLTYQCQGKPFHLLLLSPQSSDEFAHLPDVQHYNVEFNPDFMYEDLDHWLYCTDIFRGILTSLGVSSKNLFWCPP